MCPARNPRRANLKSQLRVWFVLVNGGAAKNHRREAHLANSDYLDKHKPDIQWTKASAPGLAGLKFITTAPKLLGWQTF